MTLDYYMLRKGGRVLDPANERDGQFDIGIMKGRIEIVEPDLDPDTARGTLDTNDGGVTLEKGQM